MTRSAAGRRWFVALVVAAGTLLAPPGAPRTEAASDSLLVTASATYTVQPSAQRVRVAVDFSATNLEPPSSTVITYYRSVRFPVQEEAARVRATSAGHALRTTVSNQAGLRLVEVFFGFPLYYQQSATFRVEYDLQGGAPRSDSSVRVGAAFVAFYAWTFSDEDAVRIVFPEGFAPAISGSAMEETFEDGRPVLRASGITAAARWFVFLTAGRDSALRREELDVTVRGQPETVSVGAWPEDERWLDLVGDVLTRGLPKLGDLVGVDWSVRGTLDVQEVYAPLLEGYAGIYVSKEEKIHISEALDELVILHEASHAWFNERLFKERWINEGLADETASRVLRDLGGASADPDPVDRESDTAFALLDWGAPRPIRDDEKARAAELWGYNAAWSLVRELYALAGEDGMREVIQASANDEIAYTGVGTPEKVTGADDWRRLLDLLEERAGISASDLFLEWVVPDTAEMDALTEARAAARDAYLELGEAAAGWSSPYAVRQPLSAWDFVRAESMITEARRVIDERDTLARRAVALELSMPEGLELAYEGAQKDFAGAGTIADQEDAALGRLEEATRTLAEPRDTLVQLGLAFEPEPQLRLSAARDAFEADQMAQAGADAEEAVAALVAARERGGQRVIAGGAGAGTLVGGGVAIFIIRRRRRGGGGTGPVAPNGPEVAAATLSGEEGSV